MASFVTAGGSDGDGCDAALGQRYRVARISIAVTTIARSLMVAGDWIGRPSS